MEKIRSPPGSDARLPDWFRSNLDFGKVTEGLREVGFSTDDVDGILGLNWYRFLSASLVPQSAPHAG